MRKVAGGITYPRGFLAMGAHAGIKSGSKKDLALLFSEAPAVAAAAFTTNSVKAAPVLWDIERIQSQHPLRVVVVNSGNANACTGLQGEQSVRKTVETAAQVLGVSRDEVFVSSTGVIGTPLPVDEVCLGVRQFAQLLSDSPAAGRDAAEAIMTTDTVVKQVAVELPIGGKVVRIGGMAKGSGMIHPNMATMLAFLSTDAVIDPLILQEMFQQSVAKSYNMISVDGDQSTNDTALILANGLAENEAIQLDTKEARDFQDALDYMNTYLAKAIVRDGEGATKFLEIQISGAESDEVARRFARGIARSNLVKTAFFGEDANWGRLVSAMGQAGPLDWTVVTIEIQSQVGTVQLMTQGEPVRFDEDWAKRVLTARDLTIHLSVGSGAGAATAWGCDLSCEYVRINGNYRT